MIRTSHLISLSILSITATLIAACGADESVERTSEEESAIVLPPPSCSQSCTMAYTYCFQLTGDECGCYPQYVSCMQNQCGKPPGFPPPTCDDAGAPPPPTGCEVECHCQDGRNFCTDTCAECKADCQIPVGSLYQPCG